ncbi:hypothetical protein D3C73_1224540 [compost metagenome]
MQRKLFEVIFETAEEAERFAAADLQAVSREGNLVRVAIQGNYNDFTREIAKYRIRSLDVSTQNLEDIFMNYYDRRGTAQ